MNSVKLNESSETRTFSLDIFKLVLSFLVVGLHGNLFSEINPTLSYMFVQGFARIAVPSFLLISGFYFTRVINFSNFSRQQKRLFFLYLSWMILYSCFWFDYKKPRTDLIIFSITSYNHLWYFLHAFYAMVFLYLIRNSTFLFQLICLILTAGIGLYFQYGAVYGFLPDGSDYLTHKFGILLHRNSLFFCFPFLLIGYMLNKYKLIEKVKWLNLILFLGIVSLTTEVILNRMFSSNSFDILFSLYLVCPVLFIRIHEIRSVSSNKTLAFCSTGIYVTHMAGLLLFQHFTSISPTLTVLIVFILSFIVSLLLIRIRKWLPYLI